MKEIFLDLDIGVCIFLNLYFNDDDILLIVHYMSINSELLVATLLISIFARRL